jgi:hypothetical protein
MIVSILLRGEMSVGPYVDTGNLYIDFTVRSIISDLDLLHYQLSPSH